MKQMTPPGFEFIDRLVVTFCIILPGGIAAALPGCGGRLSATGDASHRGANFSRSP